MQVTPLARYVRGAPDSGVDKLLHSRDKRSVYAMASTGRMAIPIFDRAGSYGLGTGITPKI